MGWIVFEALLALTVMMVFVWWTLRARREPDAAAEPDAPPAPDVEPDRRR